jgi:hypothetical protein
MHIAIEYNVSVTVEDKVETMCLFRKVSIFNCALNFCIGLMQSPKADTFLRSSPDSLRLVYLVAVAFRNLVVEYEELRPVRHDSESGKNGRSSSRAGGYYFQGTQYALGTCEMV